MPAIKYAAGACRRQLNRRHNSSLLNHGRANKEAKTVAPFMGAVLKSPHDDFKRTKPTLYQALGAPRLLSFN